MKKKIDIITTVGVSVVTNYLRAKGRSTSEFIEQSNQIFENTKWVEFKSDYCDFKNSIIDFNQQISKKTSAEIKTILLLKEKFEIDNIYLVHTDTIGGKFAAEILKEIFDNNNYNVVDYKKIDGINFDNAEDFQKIGFSKLIEYIDDKKTKNTALNISGGYKALIPFLTIYAQISSLPIYYVYEDSDNLIEINPTPLKFDWAIIEAIGSYLSMDYLSKQKDKNQIIEKLIENNLISTEVPFELTPMGKLMHNALFQSNISNTILGNYFEIKYFQYFSENNEKEKFRNPTIEDFDYGFKVIENKVEIKPMQRNSKGNLVQKDNYGEVEIDLIVENKQNEKYIVEVKSLFEMFRYRNIIGTKKDYLNNIKAKLLTYNQKHEKFPQGFVFLINQVHYLKDYPPVDFKQSNELETVLTHYKKSLNDVFPKIEFVVKGYNFNLVKENLTIDYTKLLRKKIEIENWINII